MMRRGMTSMELLIGGLVLAGIFVVAPGLWYYKPSITTAFRGGDVEWERLGRDIERTRTPLGWLVDDDSGPMIYVPDPKHEWLAEGGKR